MQNRASIRFTMRTLWCVAVVWCMGIGVLTAQNNNRIAEQKKVVKELERKIAEGEKEINQLRSGKSATQKQLRRLDRQINDRNRLLSATEKQSKELQREIRRADSTEQALSARLALCREQYAEMVREGWRNYRHHTSLTYIFSARSFTDIARRMVNLREMAAVRERKMEEIGELTLQVQEQRQELNRRHDELDSVSRQITGQRDALAKDMRSAEQSLQQLTQKEKRALRQKMESEEALEIAMTELRKLTKGNTTGASFSTKTQGLHLPVKGGKVKRYRENMAEITGERGADVISIYEGKVVEVKRNRITDKYEIYIAHGEYISTYSNLSSSAVTKGDRVARNARIGTIGSAIDAETMQTEYKMVFGIYPPNPKQKMRASDCFKK